MQSFSFIFSIFLLLQITYTTAFLFQNQQPQQQHYRTKAAFTSCRVIIINNARQRQCHSIILNEQTQNENFPDEESESIMKVDMNELAARIDKIRQFGPGLDDSSQAQPEKVYIILFRPGTEAEGAHTIEYPLGSKQNLMLAFESVEDCRTFAGELEKSDGIQFFNPVVRIYRLSFFAFAFVYHHVVSYHTHTLSLSL